MSNNKHPQQQHATGGEDAELSGESHAPLPDTTDDEARPVDNPSG